jgi:hypothetical protein
MSSIIGCTDNGCLGEGFCSAVLRGIENVNGLNNPSLLVEPVGTLQALFDPVNRDNASFDEIRDSSGAVKQIRVKRLPRGTYSEASRGVKCDITATAGYTENLVCVTRKAYTSFPITHEQLQAYCAESLRVGTTGNLPTFQAINDFILAKMHGLRQFINRDIISVIEANRGININYGTSAPQTVGLIQALTGAKLELGIQQIMYDLALNSVRGQWLVTGFGVFDRFNTSVQYGCCNANGLDWNAMAAASPYRYYQDFDIADVLGAPNRINIFAPGAVQFVFYNDTILGKDKIDRRHGNARIGLIPDPFVPGLTYDLVLQEETCDAGDWRPSYKVLIYLNYDVSFIPEEAYAIGDRLRTPNGIVNGIFAYNATTV